MTRWLPLIVLLAGCQGAIRFHRSADTVCGGCGSGTYCCFQTETCQPIEPQCTNVSTCSAGFALTYPTEQAMDSDTCSSKPVECSCQETEALVPGPLGRHSALAATTQGLVASAYEPLFGDLVLLSASYGDLTTVTAEIVDGQPESAVTHGPSGWRGGVSEPGPNVGTSTDIATDAQGNVLISYHDLDQRSLKFAARVSGSWAIHTVLSPTTGSAEIIGTHSKILVDSQKKLLGIAYTVLARQGGQGQFISELRWVEPKAGLPQSPEQWTDSLIERRASSCAGLCPADQACIKGEEVHICLDTDEKACDSCSTDSACVASQCQPVAKPSALPSGILWLRSTDGPTLVYHDSFANTLRVAKRSGQTWEAKEIANQGGAFPAILAEANTLHVTYRTQRNHLRYLKLNANLAVTLSELIDNGRRGNARHPVGADSTLGLDARGLLTVLYQDQQDSELLAMQRTGNATWKPAGPNNSRRLRSGPQAQGFYNRLTRHQNTLYATTFQYHPTLFSGGTLAFFKL